MNTTMSEYRNSVLYINSEGIAKDILRELTQCFLLS